MIYSVRCDSQIPSFRLLWFTGGPIPFPQRLESLRIFCLDAYQVKRWDVYFLPHTHKKNSPKCYSASKYARNPLLQHFKFPVSLLTWPFPQGKFSDIPFDKPQANIFILFFFGKGVSSLIMFFVKGTSCNMSLFRGPLCLPKEYQYTFGSSTILFKVSVLSLQQVSILKCTFTSL